MDALLQVEIDGQVLGKGIGLTWDEAKMQVILFVCVCVDEFGSRVSHDLFCEFCVPLFFQPPQHAFPHAAEKALGSLRSMLSQFSQKRQGSPRCVIQSVASVQ